VFLPDELIERAGPHARGKRCTIGEFYVYVFCVLEEILHDGNYGDPVMQAIMSAIRTDSSRRTAGRACNSW
jgi:hypothetical protein